MLRDGSFYPAALTLALALVFSSTVRATPPLRGGPLRPTAQKLADPSRKSPDLDLGVVTAPAALHRTSGSSDIAQVQTGGSHHQDDQILNGKGRHPVQHRQAEAGMYNKTRVMRTSNITDTVKTTQASTAPIPLPSFVSLWARLEEAGKAVSTAVDKRWGRGIAVLPGPVVTGRPAFSPDAPEERQDSRPPPNAIEERDREEDDEISFSGNPKYLWGLPKIFWALIADVIAMMIFVACIPFILSVAKRGSCVGRAVAQLVGVLSPAH